jgi:membrane dipeptidase
MLGRMPELLIADGHADSLMWNRDLTVASEEGHVDFPRMRQAGARLQSFTIVARGFPFVGGFPLLAWWRKWPRAAVRGEWARALWQLDRMDAFCARSGGEVVVPRTKAELDGQLERGGIAAILGVEGAHAVEGRVERVEALYARGVRFMSLMHLGNNELGGSSFPFTGNRRLTPLGRQVLDEMVRVKMAVDVAHASKATLRELLAHPTARLFSSHTGVAAEACPWRNLDDGALRTIADRGGVAGIIFVPIYLGGKRMEDLVRHIRHALRVMGEDGVALGSDFDGTITLPEGMRDVRDVPKIAGALRESGVEERIVAKVMGGNWRRFWGEILG